MEVNWTFIGIVAFFAIILVVYLIRKNLKDKEEVTKFFNENEEAKTDKKFETDDEDDL